MKPRPVTDDDLLFWAANADFAIQPKRIIIHAPPSLQGEDIGDLEAVYDGKQVRSPWVFDERDDVAPVPGLTVWLSCMGGQPPVDLVILQQGAAALENEREPVGTEGEGEVQVDSPHRPEEMAAEAGEDQAG